jgi:hypothetical protein
MPDESIVEIFNALVNGRSIFIFGGYLAEVIAGRFSLGAPGAPKRPRSGRGRGRVIYYMGHNEDRRALKVCQRGPRWLK